MDRSEIDKKLLEYEVRILSALKHKAELTPAWRKLYSEEPGVYIAFEDDVLVYAGESGCIRERLRDWNGPHIIRQHIKSKHFPSADAAEVEAMASERIRGHFKVASIPVHFGRTEFEEFLVEKHKLTRFYNKSKRRNS